MTPNASKKPFLRVKVKFLSEKSDGVLLLNWSFYSRGAEQMVSCCSILNGERLTASSGNATFLFVKTRCCCDPAAAVLQSPANVWRHFGNSPMMAIHNLSPADTEEAFDWPAPEDNNSLFLFKFGLCRLKISQSNAFVLLVLSFLF